MLSRIYATPYYTIEVSGQIQASVALTRKKETPFSIGYGSCLWQ